MEVVCCVLFGVIHSAYLVNRPLASLARLTETDTETLLPERHDAFDWAGRPGKNNI